MAGAPGPAGATLRHAYREAVTDAASALEDRAAWVRRSGDVVPARGIVGAAFEHVDNDAGHPHLHSHVVLANLGQTEDERWGCLVGSELWRWREALGAGFQLALRERLAGAGFGFHWTLGAGGLGEITSVPPPVIAAASTRSRAVEAGARWFGSESLATGRVAQGRSRRSGTGASRTSPARGLPIPGWGHPEAAAVLGAARAAPALPPPPPAQSAVTEALARRGSVFSEPDVLVALAESCPAGLRLSVAADWARRWCEAGETDGPAAGPRTGATPGTTTRPGPLDQHPGGST